MARMLSIVVLIAILVALGLLFFRVMSGFLVPVFLAALLGVIFQPLHQRVHDRFGARSRYLSAGITTFVACLAVIAPAALAITLAAMEGVSLVNDLGQGGVRERLDTLREQLGLTIPRAEDLRKIQATLDTLNVAAERGATRQVEEALLQSLNRRAERLAVYVRENPQEFGELNPEPLLTSLAALQGFDDDLLDFEDALQRARREFQEFKLRYLGGGYRAWLKQVANPDDDQVQALRETWLSSRSPLVSITGNTAEALGKLVLGALVMVATLFFLFADGPHLLDVAIKFLPLEERYVRELLTEFDRASRAVVLATLLSAVAQGLLAGIGYQFAGAGSVFLLMIVTTVFAMVPFLGAASVWMSVCVYLYFYQDRPYAAVGLAIYGALIVSLVDNLIKPLVLHGQSNLHPLLALLSILGGVQALGPIGILVGPMSVVFLQVLVRILHREYKEFEKHVESGDSIGRDLPVDEPTT
jgi:predicted PurR-regulated permease PerM